MENYNQTNEIIFDCIATVYEEWQSNPPRVEECHGYHTFNEDEIINEEITKVELVLGNGTCIDITSRLTKEELELILNQ